MQLSPARLNHLNSVLMVATCVAAYIAPFHLFLLAYAVLGPLHYFTEISWLYDHDFFAPRRTARRWWLVLVAMAMAALMVGYISNDLLHHPVPPVYEIAFVYLAFGTALMLHYVRYSVTAAALIAILLAAVALSSDYRAYFVVAYLLVTIAHVLLFTATFVLYGCLKTKSWSALLSLAVFVVCAASFFVYTPSGVAPPESIRGIYAFLEPLNVQLLKLFGFPPGRIYDTLGAMVVMRFIAFAYTYHYLNWFSKTSIIRWHAIPRWRAVGIIALWLAAIGLYYYDYAAGLAVLYLVNLLHVLLEFPLNHRTFAGIGKELRMVVAPQPQGS
ncbi:MAG TPA: hypothetical protein VEZ11_01840 [Thermoanaerobaculia bacterium]|nr:hypothetical protein [Thermoanaerobaculia bacterium]